ncbi:hypothetical protein K438DRAFT_1823691 [Mycena galopus ATCC 62051]|nr:hypothetical protein K438DRAFT_1823691 [Mycena galopus ATCC 62051]
MIRMSNPGGNLAYGLPPNISRLLYTNDPRLDYQVAEIKNSLSIAQTLKEDLGLQVTQMRMDLMRLEREEMHATKHIARCTFALAPVRRMPPEILSGIFLSYVDLLDRNECVDVKHGVWLLAHICSYWRVVALSTSELWSSCSFSCCTPLVLVQAWLKQTSSRPLSICFQCIPNPSRPEHHTYRCIRVFQALASHCARWCELELEAPPDFYSYPVVLSLYDSIPILRKLRIVALPGRVPAGTPVIKTFSIAPQLQEVSLMFFERWTLRTVLPWMEVTSFTGGIIADPHIFTNAPNLLDCTLYPADRSEPTPSPWLAEPLVHGLRHLHLHCYSLRPELLTLPALQSLRISGDDASILKSVERMLQRSMASPTTLHIDKLELLADVIALLAAAPSVAHLTLCATDALGLTGGSFFASFMENGDIPPLCPALRTLQIQGIAFGDSLVHMVGLRCVPPGREGMNPWEGARLEALTVSDVGNTHISHLLKIKDLETTAGLKFFSGALSNTRILR